MCLKNDSNRNVRDDINSTNSCLKRSWQLTVFNMWQLNVSERVNIISTEFTHLHCLIHIRFFFFVFFFSHILFAVLSFCCCCGDYTFPSVHNSIETIFISFYYEYHSCVPFFSHSVRFYLSCTHLNTHTQQIFNIVHCDDIYHHMFYIFIWIVNSLVFYFGAQFNACVCVSQPYVLTYVRLCLWFLVRCISFPIVHRTGACTYSTWNHLLFALTLWFISRALSLSLSPSPSLVRTMAYVASDAPTTNSIFALLSKSAHKHTGRCCWIWDICY